MISTLNLVIGIISIIAVSYSAVQAFKLKQIKEGKHDTPICIESFNPDSSEELIIPSVTKTGEIRKPDKLLVNSIHFIYYYEPTSDMASRKVWVCWDCETENSINEESCVLCGAKRMGG